MPTTPFDRNAQARQEQTSRQLRHQRQEFAAAFAAGRTGAVDRFGNVIAKDDLVLWHAPVDQVYQVVHCAPNLDPNVPPGMVTVALTTQIPLQYRAGVPAADLAVIGRQVEPGHMEITGPQMAVPAAAPPAPADGGTDGVDAPATDGAPDVSPIDALPDVDPQEES